MGRLWSYGLSRRSFPFIVKRCADVGHAGDSPTLSDLNYHQDRQEAS